jgi:hypothetical protein
MKTSDSILYAVGGGEPEHDRDGPFGTVEALALYFHPRNNSEGGATGD